MTTYQEISEALKRSGPVSGLELFDVHHSRDFKSMAFHITLQAPDRTLGKEDVALFLSNLQEELPRGSFIRQ